MKEQKQRQQAASGNGRSTEEITEPNSAGRWAMTTLQLKSTNVMSFISVVLTMWISRQVHLATLLVLHLITKSRSHLRIRLKSLNLQFPKWIPEMMPEIVWFPCELFAHWGQRGGLFMPVESVRGPAKRKFSTLINKASRSFAQTYTFAQAYTNRFVSTRSIDWHQVCQDRRYLVTLENCRNSIQTGKRCFLLVESTASMGLKAFTFSPVFRGTQPQPRYLLIHSLSFSFNG